MTTLVESLSHYHQTRDTAWLDKISTQFALQMTIEHHPVTGSDSAPPSPHVWRMHLVIPPDPRPHDWWEIAASLVVGTSLFTLEKERLKPEQVQVAVRQSVNDKGATDTDCLVFEMKCREPRARL